MARHDSQPTLASDDRCPIAAMRLDGVGVWFYYRDCVSIQIRLVGSKWPDPRRADRFVRPKKINLRAGDLTWAGMDLETEIPDDREHIMKEVSPHIKSLSGMVSEMIPTVSNWPADYGVPKMVEVTMFSLDHAKMDDFFHGMHKIHEMIVDKELPHTYAWSKVVVGASGAQVYLSMPRKSWSEFKEPSPGLWDVAAEVMGKREADELRARIGAAIESQESFVVAHRSDLSYVPE